MTQLIFQLTKINFFAIIFHLVNKRSHSVLHIPFTNVVFGWLPVQHSVNYFHCKELSMQIKYFVTIWLALEMMKNTFLLCFVA